MRTNLITGGMGLMGISVARKLLDAGEEVYIFDARENLPPSAYDIKDKVKILTGDISNWVHVVEAIRDSNPDCIFHFVAFLVNKIEKDPATGFNVNLLGTFNVLEAARIFNVKQVIAPSSRSTFGPASPDIVYDDTRQRPTNLYAITKLSGELLGEYYGSRYNFDFRSLRFPVVIGVESQLSYPISDINNIIKESFKGNSFVSRLDPEFPINLIYVKDVAHAFDKYRQIDEAVLSRKTYNIRGFNLTLSDLLETLQRFIPKVDVEFDTDNSKGALQLRKAMAKEMDDSLAQKEWDWQSEYLLEDTVKDYLAELESLEQSS
jgi:threonine 3-dehydrogenase